MRGSNRRRYFTAAELARPIKAARDGRYGQRDATLILLMARHGRGIMENATVQTGREMKAQLRLRCATATLAKQQSKKSVTKMLAAQGRGVHEFSAKELSLLAEDYPAKHREELMAKAMVCAEETSGQTTLNEVGQTTI